MREIIHTARFRPGDSLTQMLEDLACPGCGNRDPGEAFPSVTGDTVRMFCDGCGAFVTILLSEEQADALRDELRRRAPAGEPL